MRRPEFVLLGLVGAVSLLLVSTLSAEPTRPNILWLSTEDISSHLGCYGAEHAITPTLDTLAQRGVRYSHAFTAAGVCAPNRTAIILGMFQSSSGGHHMRCQTKLPDSIRPFPEYLRDAGYYCTNNSKTDYNFVYNKSDIWDACSGTATWEDRPAGTPFFAVFNYTRTHEGSIRTSGATYDSYTQRLTPAQRQDPDALQLPPYYPDTPIVRHDWKQYFELVTAMDYWVADHLRSLEEAGVADDTIVFFWSDHGVGLPRAKRWLYDSGTRVPLIVYMPEKFRKAGQGIPGTVDGQLVSTVDFAPTVLNLCGVDIPGYMQGRAFLGKQLQDERQYVFGARDRMDERYDIIRAVRDKRYRYIRNYEAYKPYYQFMNTPEGGPTMRELRRLHATGELPEAAELFMAETKPAEELYDLEKDPHEIHNLIDDPALREVLDRLRAAHVAWMDRSKDLGLIPEPELTVRTERLGSAYAILRQPETEDLLPRLRKIIAASEAKDATLLIDKLTRGRDAAERYWAAVGLGNMAAEAKSAEPLLVKALADQSSAVRIAAARALCRMGTQVDKARDQLVADLAHSDQWTRLSAATVLDEIGELARPAIPALHEALKDKKCKYVVRVANRVLNQLEQTSRNVP
ncbi:MAG TPA: sulfatase-like hydrolase/transferase [Thermoguttaceae bacterium]|nr:sulfatase-like hydrolase/transferase [Thermoguttaceae bacterium]